MNVGEIANDTVALEGAIREAMAVEDKPSLIVLRSHIGWPSPHKTDSAAAHGDPLGDEEVKETKQILGLPPQETFYVPDEVLTHYRSAIVRGADLNSKWQERFKAWGGDRSIWDACMNGRGLEGWEKKLPVFKPGDSMATRKAINTCLNAVADDIPGLIAGSGDLTGNTGLKLDDGVNQESGSPGGDQVHYGIREHAMASVMNGIACHKGLLPMGATFFIFSDYMRPAVRLAALSQCHVVYSWTHDSVGLGQDGPTHQPVEQLASLRAMPNLSTHQAGRRQRDRTGSRDRHQRRRSGRPRAHPPESPDPRAHRRTRRRWCEARSVRLVDGGLRRAGRGPGGNW